MILKRLTHQFAATAVLVAASGCASDNDSEADDLPAVGHIDIAQSTAALTQADSCSDLLERIQAEGIASLRRSADQLRDGEGYFGGGIFVDDDFAIAETDGAAVAEAAVSTGADPIAATPGTTNAAGDGESRAFSETNNQVQGVDEADIVKTDGDRLYLVHGSELFVLDVTQTDATIVESQVQIEGWPHEMFVRDGMAVVYSRIDPTPDLVGGEEALQNLWRFSDASHSKMTVIDLTGDAPEVLREVYTQGHYLSSRRIDGTVRSVIRGPYRPYHYDSPYIEYTNIFGDRYEQDVIDEQIDAWLERKESEIQETDLDFWLPTQLERTASGVVTIARDCDAHYVPAPGMTEPGATTVVSLNLDNVGGSLGGATILGGADQVYSNADSLVLAHHDYRFQWDTDASHQTALHHFALDGDNTVYQASGFVPGRILNQFSIDQHDGVVRVATTEDRRTQQSNPDFPEEIWFNSEPINRVFLLQGNGEELEVIGASEALGHEGERIFSARFIGDQGYVVTFRQTDPLVVLNLSDPENPEVTGELEIPGFSSYLHPMGDDHLLAIGRDGGLQLQIFDVSDPANPIQAHKHVQEGYSAAEGEHKAFNYYPEFQLLTFPFVTWNEDRRSTLEVFRVDTEGGFEHVSSIDHTEMMRGDCEDRFFEDFIKEEWGSWEEVPPEEADWIREEILWECSWSVGEVKRGVFIDELLYSISDGGVQAHHVDGFELASSLDLPSPVYNDGGGYAEPIRVGGVPAPVPVDGPEPDDIDVEDVEDVEDEPVEDSASSAESSDEAESSSEQ